MHHSGYPKSNKRRLIINKRYIAVEGPIGVGKTTLARRIATSIGAGLILEQPADNPFLERFYKFPKQYALQTQLHFLFQRFQQLKDLGQGDLITPLQIADYMLDKDPLFARLTLDADELHLYESVYRQMNHSIPTPDLVIYLQAPIDMLAERIHRRGILFERRMERQYLNRLSEAYAQFFLNYRKSALLMINVENVDFLNNAEHYELLLKQIISISSGRHYFNPVLE